MIPPRLGNGGIAEAFGVSADGALTENSGNERYDSPLRKDKRPIDGIVHACFVATRVHLAMSRMLGSGH